MRFHSTLTRPANWNVLQATPSVNPKTPPIAAEITLFALPDATWVEVPYDAINGLAHIRNSFHDLHQLSIMVLRFASRPSDTPIPAPAQPLGEDLVDFLRSPYESSALADGRSLLMGPANDPGTRDRLLAHAYTVYDASVTHQLPPESVLAGQAALLLPLLEHLHGLHPYDTPIALLLGCVYCHHDLTQRSLEINRDILRHDPHNVRSRLLFSCLLIRELWHRFPQCATWG